MTERNINSCIVIGAGIAGLLAARELQQNSLQVMVIDKGRGVGGRMATRRINGHVFDHGAQFFTVRDATFRRLVDEWLAADVVEKWSNGFADSTGQHYNDGHPRYRGAAGMTSIAKYLAKTLDVRLSARVTQLNFFDKQWQVMTEFDEIFRADALLMTPPVPQSLALLDTGDFTLPQDSRQTLASLHYDPCFAVMATLDGPSAVPQPGGIQFKSEPLHWIADNQRKGISDAPGITIHAGPEFSYQHLDTDPDTVGQLLLDAAREWIGANVLSYQVHRWRYSQPRQIYDERCYYVPTPGPLVFAGDVFGSPRIEGAALSGLAAAERLLAEIIKT